MGDYYCLPDAKSETGSTPIPVDEYVGTILKIARKKGVNITDKEILQESDATYKKSQSRFKKRAFINMYVDGTNLLAGLVEIFGYKQVPSFSSILKEINNYFKIDRIYFYASYTPAKNIKSQKIRKQIGLEINFFKEVRQLKNLIFYQGYRSPTSKKEKGVDVHLAVDMVKDAFLNTYSKAIIFTGDADLIYPIEAVRSILKKQVFSVFVPTRFSLEISYRTNGSLMLNYKQAFDKNKYRKLPARINFISIKKPHPRRVG